MHKLKLFTTFYKSTLSLSAAFAFTVAVIGIGLGFFTAFGVAFMTGGWIVSLYHIEATRKNEYVYYQNMGITKATLIVSTIVVNIIIGVICIICNHV